MEIDYDALIVAIRRHVTEITETWWKSPEGRQAIAQTDFVGEEEGFSKTRTFNPAERNFHTELKTAAYVDGMNGMASLIDHLLVAVLTPEYLRQVREDMDQKGEKIWKEKQDP